MIADQEPAQGASFTGTVLFPAATETRFSVYVGMVALLTIIEIPQS